MRVKKPLRLIDAVAQLAEELRYPGMADRAPLLVRQEILLGDVGDVVARLVLREQVIEGWVLPRTDVLGDRELPLLRVVEGGIHVEDHASERIEAVTHDLAELKACFAMDHGGLSGEGR